MEDRFATNGNAELCQIEKFNANPNYLLFYPVKAVKKIFIITLIGMYGNEFILKIIVLYKLKPLNTICQNYTSGQCSTCFVKSAGSSWGKISYVKVDDIKYVILQ